jgi:hypothetical protein
VTRPSYQVIRLVDSTDSDNAFVALVARYLLLAQERQLEAAQRFLDQMAVLTFPGNVQFHTLDEVATWASRHYRRIEKLVEHWDVIVRSVDEATVYCGGVLDGEDRDGDSFEGIRFLDRFQIQHGRIVRQDVWNDLAELGITPIRINRE